MFVFRHECPHCENLADFCITSVFEYFPQEKVSPGPIRPKVSVREVLPDEQVKAYALAACPLCHGPVMFYFETLRSSLEEMSRCVRDHRRYTGKPPRILATYPSPPQPYAHPSIPEKARSLFVDLQRLIRDVRYSERASMVVAGCRSVMEQAIKLLGGEGPKLKAKIDDLLQKGIITRILADWAHTIRLEGNQAVHEINATQEEAEEMVEFLKIFLQFTFELPARIREKRRSS